MDKTSLGDRMKGYESVAKNNLMRKTPVILRLDGKAFHTYTKHIPFSNSPFSPELRELFLNAGHELIRQVQGARFAYLQSDEISILLSDWENLTTDGWFGYNIQKIASVSASIFTYYFNYTAEACYGVSAPAFFDARVFNLPANEVINYFIWRQQDATRNSINTLGRVYFSPKQLHGKSTSDVQDMLMESHQINWNTLQTVYKRGACIYLEKYVNEKSTGVIIDPEIPVFTSDRDYIEQFLS